MLLSYKPLYLEAQQHLQEEGCVADITHQVAVVEEQCGDSPSILRTNYVRIPELFMMMKSMKVEIKKKHQVLMVDKTTNFKKKGKGKERELEEE